MFERRLYAFADVLAILGGRSRNKEPKIARGAPTNFVRRAVARLMQRACQMMADNCRAAAPEAWLCVFGMPSVHGFDSVRSPSFGRKRTLARWRILK